MLYSYSQETESQRKHKASNEVLGPRRVPITREEEIHTLEQLRLMNTLILIVTDGLICFPIDLLMLPLSFQ